jgi:hypothetical protein
MPLPLPPALRKKKCDESILSSPIPLLLLSVYATRRFDVITGAGCPTMAGAHLPMRMMYNGTNGGRAIWAKHHDESSVHSVNSDFSGVRLGRPGLGDKMLESTADYCGAPLMRLPLVLAKLGAPNTVTCVIPSFNSARDPSALILCSWLGAELLPLALIQFLAPMSRSPHLKFYCSAETKCETGCLECLHSNIIIHRERCLNSQEVTIPKSEPPSSKVEFTNHKSGITSQSSGLTGQFKIKSQHNSNSEVRKTWV